MRFAEKPQPESMMMSGAVDCYACPSRMCGTPRDVLSLCKCEPRCAVCDWGKHDGPHGPRPDGEPGSEPLDHEFVPAESE